MPATPQIDSEGRHHVIDGKKQYRPLREWKDRQRSDSFGQAVIAALLKKHPQALDAGSDGPVEQGGRS